MNNFKNNLEYDKKSQATDFLKTDRGKTKSNQIEIPSITLPKGGGAIKGIDEKFTVNAVNGTTSFSVPIPVSQARGVSPQLSLSYNSGSGNGIFGIGWNLSLSSIKRKTDKELPQYLDSIDSDTFLLSEAEDLVPEFKKNPDGSFSKDANGDYITNEKISSDGLFTIRYYRPRIEGLFSRIEQWIEKSNGKIKWRIITKDNITTLFGWNDDAQLSDFDNSTKITKIFEWLPQFIFDDKGNCAQYFYKRDNKIGFDELLVHNKNRVKNDKITYTNLYPDKILYGNKTPYKKFGDDFPDETNYLFKILFDYGTTNYETEAIDKLNPWDFRPDAFSNYKAGFEIRTTRLCKRVLLYHHFKEKDEYDGLVRSVNFEYDTSIDQNFTFLKSISTYGYIKKPDGSYSSKKLPSVKFKYQEHEWNSEIKTVSQEALVHAPIGIEQTPYQFVDLFNEGLSGILSEQANGWYYKHNLGVWSQENNSKLHFEQAKLVSAKPSFTGLIGNLQLMDLDADGGKQLVSFEAEPRGYFELDDDNEWSGLRYFKALPNVNFGDPNTRMIDLNGDGKPEVIISEDQVFTWYTSDGRDGFSASRTINKPFDEEEGPHMVFADSTQSIYLADMSGDGMVDILRIRNGEVCYWPNMGYGKFGAKVTMDNAPLFDHPDNFNPNNLRLADIDGSGTSDIIYLGKNKFTCWINLSGNRFKTKPFEIDPFPEFHTQAKVTVTDLLGNGVACIVWSSPLLKDAESPLRYIDLMNSKKPHIMIYYENNLGKEVELEYTPSTKFYIEDKLSGKPWVTKLHFPVHCVSRTITKDKISGYKFISEYKYHHGYYDHAEREFRGFGLVEQIDAESIEHWVKQNATNITEEPLHQEPVVVKKWFHTGAFLRNDIMLSHFEKDYWYHEFKREFGTVNHPEKYLPDARLTVPESMDASLLDHLTAEEWREALRACKGMPLRTETFAKDAIKFGNTEEVRKKEFTPFSVIDNSCVIELLQPRGKNKHAVFVVKENESINYNYERNSEDPRISHNLNLKLDEYGNVLESAAIVYTRMSPNSSLPLQTQQDQSKTVIIYTKNQFTNDVIGDHIYRLRLPSETKTFELKGVTKSGTYYTPTEFTNILSDVKSDTALYHELNKVLVPNKAQKRLIENIRSTYYLNNLSGPLPLHQLESLALSFENYQLAYTPELVTDIFGTKVNAGTLIEGKFTHSENDNNWWVRSGTIQYKTPTENQPDAQNRFYTPKSYTDPYNAITRVKYYSSYFLFIEETEDALGNVSKVANIDQTKPGFNFRTLSPEWLNDINGNYSASISDELGFIKAMAVMGKGNEADDLSDLSEVTNDSETNDIHNFFNAADSVQLTTQGKSLLKNASTRFIYDFDTFTASGKPAVVAAITREKHFKQSADSPIQIAFEYSNGIGEVVMKKVQAEPGIAKKVKVNQDNSISIAEINTNSFNPKQLRWIGNGRTIKNNKANAVKQYEPYFSVTWHYEDHKELVETGVTPIMYYDALGRLIKTQMPDGTFSKVEFDSWKQVSYDANDNILEPECTWFINRNSHSIDKELLGDFKDPVKEKKAAEKSAIHSNTPTELHLDTLGRPVLQIENNGKDLNGLDILLKTKVELDIEGNLLSVKDARELAENDQKGNTVMQYKYDMLGNQVYQNSMDAGQRWLLTNVLANPLRTWDERDHEFQYEYDILHRPILSRVINNVGKQGDEILNNIFDKIIYGESEANAESRNVKGKIIKHFDTGGLIDTPEYDFKGQPKFTTRKLFKNYNGIVNWEDGNLTNDLESESFTFTTETDAIGRITKQIAPDGSVIISSYNPAGLLNSEKIIHSNPNETIDYINEINYNEKRQRIKINYGNGVTTDYVYDKQTFRLILLTTKKNSDNSLLQELHYTYDPVGNITHIEDNAIPKSFFANNVIEPVSEYTYDSLYRLIKATGRENKAALNFDINDNWNDAPYKQTIDSTAIWNYTQEYTYDKAGNITQMKHSNDGNKANWWTRDYEYEANKNRLKNTNIGQGINAFKYSYTHHETHGFITIMPHLHDMEWNFKEELIRTSRQKVNPGHGMPETTYYQYDWQGQRIRKITENSSAANNPTKKDERIYISGYETFITYQGNAKSFERESLSLIEKDHRFVMIETIKKNTDAASPEVPGTRLTRYQLHNHLGSSSLELDNTAQVISYEEYHPYGTTSYQANSAKIKTSAKRYRYTGMERDDENGFNYHSARYYLPWLGRWISCDPIGMEGGINLYSYSKLNTLNRVDKNGKKDEESDIKNFSDPKDSKNWSSLEDYKAYMFGQGFAYAETEELWQKTHTNQNEKSGSTLRLKKNSEGTEVGLDLELFNAAILSAKEEFGKSSFGEVESKLKLSTKGGELNLDAHVYNKKYETLLTGKLSGSFEMTIGEVSVGLGTTKTGVKVGGEYNEASLKLGLGYNLSDNLSAKLKIEIGEKVGLAIEIGAMTRIKLPVFSFSVEFTDAVQTQTLEQSFNYGMEVLPVIRMGP